VPPLGATGEGRWRRQLCCMVQGALVEPAGRGRSTCSSGKSVLVACTLVQSIQHSRAEVRATLFRPIEKVPKASPMYHSICPAHTARARCFVPAFRQSPRRHKELFGLGLRRIQCCDRFSVLAVLHCGACFPNRHGGFPVLTAAALRHLVRPLDAAPPANADADRKRPHLSFCSHTQYSGRGGNLKNRSRRRLALAASLPVIGS